MLDTFIKNKGITKTVFHKNNKNYYNEVNWDADYDGENANLSLDIDDNGTKGHVEMNMNNDELAELLNIPSENNTLDKRLYRDFLSKRPKHDYKIVEIHHDIPKSILHNDSYSLLKNKKNVHFKNENGMDDDYYTHISSPEPQEELFIPLILNETKTRKHKKHKKPKTHVTYKVYRKHRRSPSSASSASSSSRKTLRRHHRNNGHSRRTF